MSTQIGQRLVFQNSKNAIKRAGLNPASAVLSQSYLRFEVPLAVGTTTYTFDTLVNENTNPNFVTQSKLNLQDAFVTSAIGFFLAVPASSATTETAFPLYSYPNQVAFASASDTDAYTIYNGNMQLTVNQRTIMTGWDLTRHYFVPQTQGLVTRASSSPYNAIDQLDLSENGFYPAEPNIVMVGSKKNILQVNLNTGLASIQANSRLVCIFRGILAQNVTPVN
jgi:hypothetical protein